MSTCVLILPCTFAQWVQVHKTYFLISFRFTSFNFLSQLMQTKGFLFSICGDKSIWGNWTISHKGPAHCSIKPSMQKKTINFSCSSWNTNHNSKRCKRGLVEGSPYPKTMNHENKKRFICLDTIKIQVVTTIKINQLNVVCPLLIPTICGPQVIPKIMS